MGKDTKRVLVDLGNVRPTIPPEDDAPPSVRNPICDFCQNKLLLLGPGTENLELRDTLMLCRDMRGWEFIFVCHGRTDPTRVIQIRIRIGDVSGPEIRRNGDGSPAEPPILPNREAEILMIRGAEKWAKKGIQFKALCGSVEDPTSCFRGARKASPLIGKGTFLVFKDLRDKTHVVRLPVAHIAVRRA